MTYWAYKVEQGVHLHEVVLDWGTRDDDRDRHGDLAQPLRQLCLCIFDLMTLSNNRVVRTAMFVLRPNRLLWRAKLSAQIAAYLIKNHEVPQGSLLIRMLSYRRFAERAGIMQDHAIGRQQNSPLVHYLAEGVVPAFQDICASCIAFGFMIMRQRRYCRP